MTPLTPRDDLRDTLAGVRCVLLDFDGPICSIFAGHPADLVATDLLRLLRLLIETDTSKQLAAEQDPLEVLRHAAQYGPQISRQLDAALKSAELSAVDTARPTPDAADVLAACKQTGRTVAIVSNNSASAIAKYLAAHSLTEYVQATVGRSHTPGLMKPNPHPIRQALQDLRAANDESVLVGDSVSDIQAARQTGIRSIGFANKPSKQAALAEAGPDAVITSMRHLVSALHTAGRETLRAFSHLHLSCCE